MSTDSTSKCLGNIYTPMASLINLPHIVNPNHVTSSLLGLLARRDIYKMADLPPKRLLDDVVNTRTMRSTSSTADDMRRARDIRFRTVVLRLDPAGKPYSRLDVAHGLMQASVFKDSFKEIEGLGSLSRNA